MRNVRKKTVRMPRDDVARSRAAPAVVIRALHVHARWQARGEQGRDALVRVQDVQVLQGILEEGGLDVRTLAVLLLAQLLEREIEREIESS